MAEYCPNIVLVVDPDKAYRDKLGKSLEEFTETPFQVLWAESLAEAQVIIKKIPPNIIVSEIDLPDSKGKLTFDSYGKFAKGIPLVILTDIPEKDVFGKTNDVRNERYCLKSKVSLNFFVASLKYIIESDKPDDASGYVDKKILIVDDDVTSRFVLINYLKEIGCVIEEAEDGFMALAILRKHAIQQTPFHLVIVDLMMPNMDGFEFLSTLRKRSWGKSIPLLVSSSRKDPEAIIKVKYNNIKGYLLKPVTRENLLEKVTEALRESNSYKDNI